MLFIGPIQNDVQIFGNDTIDSAMTKQLRWKWLRLSTLWMGKRLRVMVKNIR